MRRCLEMVLGGMLTVKLSNLSITRFRCLWCRVVVLMYGGMNVMVLLPVTLHRSPILILGKYTGFADLL